MADSLTRRQRKEGGLLGLLVGDALGVPYEFHSASDIPPHAQIEMTPPPGYARTYPQVPPGTWSDDGAQALCLLASLLECGQFDAKDFGQRLLRWRSDGYMAVGGDVFDIGITTNRALSAIQSGTPALRAGPSRELDNGNGSLMRVLPLALWHSGSDDALIQDAHAQSRVTHGHKRSQVCCALYCLWARRILEESPSPWADAVAALRALYADHPTALAELESSVQPDTLTPGTGSGYVVDSLRSAHWIIEKQIETQTADYAQAVRAAIALGQDTDTTACITGGIAGLLCGADGIPKHWLDTLRGMEMVQPLLEGIS